MEDAHEAELRDRRNHPAAAAGRARAGRRGLAASCGNGCTSGPWAARHRPAPA